MSGGHFDYKCYQIGNFADELQHEIDVNDSEAKDEYGYTIGQHYAAPTVERLKVCCEIIALAARLAREAEWLYSGDHGEDSFNEIYDKILKNATGSLIYVPKCSKSDG